MKPVLIAAALALPSLAAAQAPATTMPGQAAFAECAACHSLEPGVNEIGPSLKGVLGRKAGTAEGFTYSPAMTRSTTIWSAETLDRFLADPQAAMPGNRMPYAGLPSNTERAALIAYLQAAAK